MKTKLYFFLWVCLSTLLIACVDDDIEPDVVPVTGVSLNKTALALDEGESESLIATVIPDNATNKKVTWKSSDTSVATVNASGKVTAQATGTVVVVVITEDGAEVATCTVTCGDGAVEPEIPVGNIPYFEAPLEDPYVARQYTADEIYAEIMADLEVACEDGILAMTTNAKDDGAVTDRGRVCRAAALMLKARVVMYQKDQSRYAEVANDMATIIKSGKFDLMDDFDAMWLPMLH